MLICDILSPCRQVSEFCGLSGVRWQLGSSLRGWLKRRKLKLTATFESRSSNVSFKRSHPGAFNLGLIGSTCTALPSCAASRAAFRLALVASLAVTARVGIESNT